MNNLIGICGHHNSGKTTLIEKLIKWLKNDGYKIVTIKNIPKKFSIDTEGKDTWKHGQAGASVVVASSPDETAFIFKRGMELKEIADILNEIAGRIFSEADKAKIHMTYDSLSLAMKIREEARDKIKHRLILKGFEIGIDKAGEMILV